MQYPLQDAMYKKDPELYAEVYLLNPWEAARKWREKYPEDFEGVYPYSRLHEVLSNPLHIVSAEE